MFVSKVTSISGGNEPICGVKDRQARYAVLRHSDDQKWFGLIMNVPRDKLGLKGEGEVDVIDIKCHPAKVDDLKRTPGFKPAYHMNKEHWLTAVLDGSISRADVFALLDDSYELTK
ncbi:MmcQ/YjbR family DNA-binding protein [Mesorhizobium sp. WSM4935]|uniref:MmcQ/YjbR family DNA-binding protein n=1 Tax=Mesorhizobium sp. WSM4935 TaxID=3038547 RepID=UPI00241536AA|nr:MmcQ/YjbR family DNA-binding protein [Mesorhizobium sp. WSM4935]MDG4877202.1 MmcQ/YjbR family DNA-binding protein [Mesorhizobium sp. WSM4935]